MNSDWEDGGGSDYSYSCFTGAERAITAAAAAAAAAVTTTTTTTRDERKSII